MRLIVLLSLLLVASTFSPRALSDEGEGLTIYPHVGKMFVDDDLENDNLVGLGLGYRFNNPWTVELTYQTGEADFSGPAPGDSDIDIWHLGALYHLKQQGAWQPFLSFGAGRASFDTTLGDDDDTQLNAGVGVKWSFSERGAIRGDLKLFTGGSPSPVEQTVTLGLHFALGGSSHAAAPAYEPEPAAAPAPAPAVDGDADGDGVADSADRCPGTPAGVPVNSRGCPMDDDGDGVYNHMDDCPGTTDRKAKVDARGCYIKLERKVNITLNVEFDFDSSQAREEHAVEVRKVANFMREYPDSNVVMEGHTDSRGSEAYNQGLSERRASTIADMLINRFNIPARRVSSEGHGELQPIATNDTDEGRQRNRRVVAAIEGEKEELEMK